MQKKVHDSWDDSLEFDPSTYGDQEISRRMADGREVDRQYHSWRAAFDRMLLKMAPAGKHGGGCRPRHHVDWNIPYLHARRYWENRRRINEKISNAKRIQERINALGEMVILDLLDRNRPTVKKLGELSEYTERQHRRIEEEYCRDAVSFGFSRIRLELRKEDGTVDAYPKRLERARIGKKQDRRVKPIMTPYSRPPERPRVFDPMVFVDAAYLGRENRFWRHATRFVSRFLESETLRPEKEWLVYHIVNNDIATHVIFNGLSEECEKRWFGGLGTREKLKIITVGDGIPLVGRSTYSLTAADVDEAVEELRRGHDVRAFGGGGLDNVERYRVPEATMKKRLEESVMEAALESISSYGPDHGNWKVICDGLTRAVSRIPSRPGPS